MCWGCQSISLWPWNPGKSNLEKLPTAGLTPAKLLQEFAPPSALSHSDWTVAITDGHVMADCSLLCFLPINTFLTKSSTFCDLIITITRSTEIFFFCMQSLKEKAEYPFEYMLFHTMYTLLNTQLKCAASPLSVTNPSSLLFKPTKRMKISEFQLSLN